MGKLLASSSGFRGALAPHEFLTRNTCFFGGGGDHMQETRKCLPKTQCKKEELNTVMNTLIDTITKCHPDSGYQLSSSSIKSNQLQYAADTSLLASGPASCKAMLTSTEAWLKSSGMKAYSMCLSACPWRSKHPTADPLTPS